MLRAGPLTCELDGGNLRYVRIGGREAMRAIAFIVRDKNWGTYNPEIQDLKIGQGPRGFEVSYEAICGTPSRSCAIAADQRRSRRRVELRGDARPVSEFVTDRTGFVVLHPLEGVAGRPVEVLHTDGRRVRSTSPS